MSNEGFLLFLFVCFQKFEENINLILNSYVIVNTREGFTSYKLKFMRSYWVSPAGEGTTGNDAVNFAG